MIDWLGDHIHTGRFHCRTLKNKSWNDANFVASCGIGRCYDNKVGIIMIFRFRCHVLLRYRKSTWNITCNHNLVKSHLSMDVLVIQPFVNSPKNMSVAHAHGRALRNIPNWLEITSYMIEQSERFEFKEDLTKDLGAHSMTIPKKLPSTHK